MVYISPIEEKTEDIELSTINRAADYQEERFNFSMYFLLGIILLLIGFFRMILFNQIAWLNLAFVVAGLLVSLGSQKWMKQVEKTDSEKELITRRQHEQYSIHAADFGFAEQIHRNRAKDKYTSILNAQKENPDVDHKNQNVDATTMAPQDPKRKYTEE